MFNYLLCYFRLKSMLKIGQVYYDYDMRQHSTFRIGGKAKVFVKVASLEEVIKVHHYVTTHDINYFILGNGSNTLISSHGFKGVVIYFGQGFSSIKVEGTHILADAGAYVSQVFTVAKAHELSGLEGTAGLPASVGGMVYMNASCFGFETSSIVSSVLALVDGKIRLFSCKECGFGYRDSVFQHMDRPIILRVEFSLTHASIVDIESRRVDVLKKRLDIQPKGYSCGCVFRRKDGLQVSKMLDDLGVKGASVGDSFVSDKHANFIINRGKATSADVIQLIHNIEDRFYDAYGISLDREIEFLGDRDEIIR